MTMLWVRGLAWTDFGGHPQTLATANKDVGAQALISASRVCSLIDLWALTSLSTQVRYGSLALAVLMTTCIVHTILGRIKLLTSG